MSKSSQVDPSIGELSPETIERARQRELEYENTRKALKIRYGLHKLNVRYDVWISNGFTIDPDGETYQNFPGMLNTALIELCSCFAPIGLQELQDIATDLDMTLQELAGECFASVAIGNVLPSYKAIQVKQRVIAKYKPKTTVIEFAMLMHKPPPERIVLKIVDGEWQLDRELSFFKITNSTNTTRKENDDALQTQDLNVVT